MSIVKYISFILTEQISEKKREALFNLFLKTYGAFKKAYEVEVNEEDNITQDAVDKNKDLVLSVFDKIIELDPTPNNQYTQWLITKGLKSKYGKSFVDIRRTPKTDTETEYFGLDSLRIMEDKESIKELIQVHFEKKQSPDFPLQYKDINKIDSIKTLNEILKKYIVGVDSSFDDIMTYMKVTEGKDYLLLANDGNTFIYKPLTQRGACALGGKTKWCTTWGEYSVNKSFKTRTSQFKNYKNEDGNGSRLFVIRHKHKDDELFQIDFPTEQFMDVDDDNVGLESCFDGASQQIKDMFSKVVYSEMPKIFDRLETYWGITDMAEFKLKKEDREYINILDGKVLSWDYYDYHIDITEFDDLLDDENISIIKKKIVQIIPNIDKKYVNTMTQSELMKFLTKTKEVKYIGDIIEESILYSQRIIDSQISSELLSDVVARNAKFENYEELEKNITERGAIQYYVSTLEDGEPTFDSLILSMLNEDDYYYAVYDTFESFELQLGNSIDYTYTNEKINLNLINN
jgi:hypothetical protein